MYQLKQYYRCQFACRRCLATRAPGPLCYGNLGPDAMHRRTFIQPEHCMLKSREREPLVATTMPGFTSDRIWFDSMHI